ncbi:MAG TPA: tetratricopeptide repeat protein [Terriglobales bacterium]|nr:tetratricopeptide repeat protein [Terriglobales bacterium]
MAKWLLVLLILCAASAWSQTAPFESVELNRLGLTSETDKQTQTLQDRVKEAPGDYAGYDGLGSAFLQKARETGDIAYYGLAEQTLKKALALAPQDFRAADPLVHLALVYMGEHRFSDALAYAQKAIGTGSGNLAAFAIEGDAYTDMGDYDEAATSYNIVQSLGRAISSPLALAYLSDSRMGYLCYLRGDSAEAIRLMKSAIAAALQTNVPRENLAWLYFELGERYFQIGDLRNADLSYQSGITADPNHYRSLAGLAKVRAAQGKLEESIQLYQRSIAIIPFPVYVAELGDVYKKAGRVDQAQQQYDLVEYIGHLSKLNQVLANRELALFYADQGIKLLEALELARKELEVRHDIYTWDTLAWVLYRNGRFQEAAEAINKGLGLHTNDSLLLFHAGMIYHSLAKDSDAEDFLSRALTTNPHFHVLHTEVANRTLEDIAQSHNRD